MEGSHYIQEQKNDAQHTVNKLIQSIHQCSLFKVVGKISNINIEELIGKGGVGVPLFHVVSTHKGFICFRVKVRACFHTQSSLVVMLLTTYSSSVPAGASSSAGSSSLSIVVSRLESLIFMRILPSMPMLVHSVDGRQSGSDRVLPVPIHYPSMTLLVSCFLCPSILPSGGGFAQTFV